MAQETSKATERRMQNVARWCSIFREGGLVLDVGPGDDPMVWPGCEVVPFDKAQGDANKIDEYYPDGANFDAIHGSQVMEHLYDPTDFINRCLSILTPGGWIVMTVPDYDLYEKRNFPSKYNPDHKTTWSLWRRGLQPVAHKHEHIHVPTWISQFPAARKHANLIHTNYDYLLSDDVDQTWLREDGIECFIEILIQKP